MSNQWSRGREYFPVWRSSPAVMQLQSHVRPGRAERNVNSTLCWTNDATTALLPVPAFKKLWNLKSFKLASTISDTDQMSGSFNLKKKSFLRVKLMSDVAANGWSSRGTKSHEDVCCWVVFCWSSQETVLWDPKNSVFYPTWRTRPTWWNFGEELRLGGNPTQTPPILCRLRPSNSLPENLLLTPSAQKDKCIYLSLFFPFHFCCFLKKHFFFSFCPFENVSWVHFNSLLSRGGKTFGFADRVYRTKHAQQTSHRRPAHTWLLHTVLDTRWFGENCCFVVPLCYIFNVLSQSFCHWASLLLLLLLLFFSFHISASFVFFVFLLYRRCLRLIQLLETLKGQSIDSHMSFSFWERLFKKKKEKENQQKLFWRLTRKPKWNLPSP